MTATVTVLFCGAGGDTLGAETAGMRDVMAAGSWQRGDLVLIQWLAGARDGPGELANWLSRPCNKAATSGRSSASTWVITLFTTSRTTIPLAPLTTTFRCPGPQGPSGRGAT
jgi:hypothetical protein